MFGRLALLLQRALPLSALAASCFLSLSIPRMAEEGRNPRWLPDPAQLFRRNHPRIKYVRDLGEYVDKLLVRERSIILFELTGDAFIDEQVIGLAERFVEDHADDLSTDFEFIFLEERHALTEEKDEENYFILYGPHGEKLINIDPYINKAKNRPALRLNTRPLSKRLVESLNLYREVGLDNIASELTAIETDSNYVALLVTATHNYQTDSARKKLKAFEKEHQTKARNVSKFVVKDEYAKRILGLKQNGEGVYLLVADSSNLRRQFRERAEFVSINGRKFTSIDASSNLEEVFVFPPVQRSLAASDYVLNVYVNKNQNYEQMEGAILEELSKPEYRQYHKALYYTSDVEEAALYYEKNDYSSECLQAYEPNTTLPRHAIAHVLTNSFQYELPLNAKDGVDGSRLRAWLKDCEAGTAEQHFQSEKEEEGWAQKITGEEYREIVQQPGDKVIYHYSQHCHGCKKFGGKFEEFARRRTNPQVAFYRINNDSNKAQGVRNYNSTPIFVFYKDGSLNPFHYKMPIFTEQLFADFLSITSRLHLLPAPTLDAHLASHAHAQGSVESLLQELRS